jgi:hypothetical protein
MMINAHLLIEKAWGEYSSNSRKLKKMAEIIQQVMPCSIFHLGSNIPIEKSILQVQN